MHHQQINALIIKRQTNMMITRLLRLHQFGRRKEFSDDVEWMRKNAYSTVANRNWR